MEKKKKYLKMNRIKDEIQAQGRQQKWVAEQLGVTQKTLSFWCANKTQPDLGNLFELSKILGVEPSNLLGNGKEVENH